MKVRSIALGLSLSPEDLLDFDALAARLRGARDSLVAVQRALQGVQHKVQTLRIVFNSFEDWLLPFASLSLAERIPEEDKARERERVVAETVTRLDALLQELQIDFCSLGAARDPRNFAWIPLLLSLSPRVHASVLFVKERESDVAPDYAACLSAATACKAIASQCGDLGNFRFCCAFQCPPQSPFFPQAYHATRAKDTLSLGLENADLLFLAYFGVKDDAERGKENLETVFLQALRPLQAVVAPLCEERGIVYAGLDVSVNPGLSVIDSVGAGLEHLLNARESERERHFGSAGTLAAVATTTAALRAVQREGSIKTAGYCGLMLPVMEDATLALRNNEGRFTLRDLLLFSSVCGVGLDTVPVAGDVSVSAIASVYRDTGAMAFRLDKPLSCRLLPMQGKREGEMTDVESPYLCNTRVFAMP